MISINTSNIDLDAYIVTKDRNQIVCSHQDQAGLEQTQYKRESVAGGSPQDYALRAPFRVGRVEIHDGER